MVLRKWNVFFKKKKMCPFFFLSYPAAPVTIATFPESLPLVILFICVIRDKKKKKRENTRTKKKIIFLLLKKDVRKKTTRYSLHDKAFFKTPVIHTIVPLGNYYSLTTTNNRVKYDFYFRSLYGFFLKIILYAYILSSYIFLLRLSLLCT